MKRTAGDCGSEPRLARVGAMIGDPARSRMLAYLLDGRYASSGELAEAAAVSASTASGHLGKLVEAGLLAYEQRGRHHYFRLADGEVALALEGLALLAERTRRERTWSDPAMTKLRYARRCYGHLAGALGVALFEGLVRSRLLTPADGAEFVLGLAGEEWLQSIGLRRVAVRGSGRFAYPCLDWSERRDHLAGALGSALLDQFLQKGWLIGADAAPADGREARRRGFESHRCLTLTEEGKQELLPILARLSK